MGRVGPHVEVKVVDPVTGLTVPRNEPGELCTRGYSVMLGYWRQPDKTNEVIDAARWMHTGDLAVMDDDGYLSHHRPDQGHGRSAAARTSTRARSRSSSTPTPTSWTPR